MFAVQAVGAALASLGLAPLEHFPGEDGARELWQSDNDIDSPLVVVIPYTNSLGKASAWVDIDRCSGDSVRLFGRNDGWDVSDIIAELQ